MTMKPSWMRLYGADSVQGRRAIDESACARLSIGSYQQCVVGAMRYYRRERLMTEAEDRRVIATTVEVAWSPA